MIRFKAMINIKITKRNITEDYIAVERETGSILLPSKHVFGIFSIGVISPLLVLLQQEELNKTKSSNRLT